MTKLTSLQLALLRSAAAADDGSVPAPQAAKDKSAATRLVRRGLMISLPLDGLPGRLLLTEAGRAALPAEERNIGSAEPATPALQPREPRRPPGGKLGIIVGLLQRSSGATIAEMTQATGWQAHSVRGAISGSLKKAMKLSVISERGDVGRVYRIIGELA